MKSRIVVEKMSFLKSFEHNYVNSITNEGIVYLKTNALDKFLFPMFYNTLHDTTIRNEEELDELLEVAKGDFSHEISRYLQMTGEGELEWRNRQEYLLPYLQIYIGDMRKIFDNIKGVRQLLREGYKVVIGTCEFLPC